MSRPRSTAPHGDPLPGHALVIGGSLAGLLAARVLTEHFAHVTIVERDHVPDAPAPRAGVPQARHVHILLLEGQRLLERFFPGLGRDLTAAGAPAVDMVRDFPVMGLGGWAPRFPSPFIARTCSRSLLEETVRHRLLATGRVVVRGERQVTAVVATETAGRVTGVRARVRGEAALPLETYHADLVVDASGRTSQAPQWLQALGYPPPKSTIINAFLGYATCWYQRPDLPTVDWKGLLITSKAPHNGRGGVIFPVEGDRWVVTLSGVGRDYPPTDPAGFLAFARTLRSPLLYDAIREAVPLSPVYGYQRTENVQRHYDRMLRRPEGFVVLGDAACAFNPVYGQGMTVAALAAQALERCVRAQRAAHPEGLLDGLAERFQAQLAHATATPWLMATGEDLRWPTTVGGQPRLTTRLMHRYLDGVLTVTAHNPQVYRAFIQVTHLCAPPVILFQPRVALPVLRWALSQPRPPEQQVLPAAR